MVEDVESHLMVFEGIGHFKEKPLRITIGIDIILQQQIVLIFRYFWNQW